MQTLTIHITDPLGIHALVVSQLIGLIEPLNCDIFIEKKSKSQENTIELLCTQPNNPSEYKCNLRDFFLVLKLNICYADYVIFEFIGPEAKQARAVIANYFA